MYILTVYSVTTLLVIFKLSPIDGGVDKLLSAHLIITLQIRQLNERLKLNRKLSLLIEDFPNKQQVAKNPITPTNNEELFFAGGA